MTLNMLLNDAQKSWKPKMEVQERESCCTPCSTMPHKQVNFCFYIHSFWAFNIQLVEQHWLTSMALNACLVLLNQVTDQTSPLDDRFDSLSLSAQSYSTRASGGYLCSFGDVTCEESLLSPNDNEFCNSPSISSSGNALFEHDVSDLYDVALLIR
jgi:hypothetical protein